MFIRFWRGEYSLALSFWVIAPLVAALAFALPEGVGYLVRGQDFNPSLILAAIVAIWAIVVFAQLYLTVGVWRSAVNHRRDGTIGKRAPWGVAAQAVLVVAALNLLRVFVLTAVAELTEGTRMAFLDDPALPPYSMRLIRARDLVTYTSVACASACTIAYTAARERYLKAGARLGFHRSVFAGNENAGEMRRPLLAAGIEPSFVERAVAQPASSIWYPTDAELTSGRVVSTIVDFYRYAASGFGGQAPLAVFKNALRQTPLALLETSDSQLFEEMAELCRRRYFEDRSAGQIEDELRVAKISPFIARRLPQADDDILIDYARLYADQYAALKAHDPAACFTFATKGGDARLVALLGAELQQRELALTDRVLRSTSARPPPLPAIVQLANTAVFKALSAQFDAPAVNLLADPAKVQPQQYDLFCRVAIARFRAIAALPERQAGELMSSLFSAAKPASR